MKRSWMKTTLLALGLFCAGHPAWAMASPSDNEHTARGLAQQIEAYRVVSAEQGTYDVVFHRDPMRSLIDPEGHVIAPGGLRAGLSVPGIIWSPQRPFVVVDQDLLTNGQRVGPYTVLRVRPNGVLARYHKEKLWIPLEKKLALDSSAPSQ